MPPPPASGERDAAAPALPAEWHNPLPVPDPGATPAWGAGAFGDPLLAALVDEAMAANTDLEQARAALAQARALRDVAAAASALQLDASARAARSRSGPTESNSWQPGLDASWEADVFGARGAAIDAAAARSDAAARSLEATRLAVAGEVALAYLQWQGSRRQWQIASESLARQLEQLQLTEWRVQAGVASALDAAQARSSAEQTRARLPALQQTLAQTGHRLAVLVGRPPGALASRLAATPLAPDPTARAAETLPLPDAGVPADLLRRRPDLRAAEADITAALATLAQREAERRPRFVVSGSLALQAATLPALGSSGALLAGIAASVSAPLLDGGSGAAQVAAQQAALADARARYRAAVLSALQDVEDALVSIGRGRERVEQLARAADAARDALDLARFRHDAGLLDLATLLDAERNRLATEDALASARTDLALGRVRLAKSLGGGWGAAATPGGPP